jgi:hypothetical protein
MGVHDWCAGPLSNHRKFVGVALQNVKFMYFLGGGNLTSNFLGVNFKFLGGLEMGSVVG